MNKRVKCTSAVILILIIAFCLFGCGREPQVRNEKYTIVCSIFPQYDWVRNIVGDNENIDVVLLVDNGVDLHSYQPSAKDIITISTCDMFIYVGGESDAWVDEVLVEAKNPDIVVVDMMDVLGEALIEEELKEGMTADRHADDDEGEDELEYDEHIWVSIKNAEVLCQYIAEKISENYKNDIDTLYNNLYSYLDKLKELDDKYVNALSDTKYDTILFGDRFPFSYLVNDYDIDYYAAFVGCSAESEASFETITFLADKMDKKDLKYILIVDGTDGSLAKTIIDNSADKNREILNLNSLQSVTATQIADGVTYISIMENNLEILKLAMN